jgi:hypothetical protein
MSRTKERGMSRQQNQAGAQLLGGGAGEYSERDPVVTNRDPVMAAKPDKSEEKSFDNVPIVRCQRPACPACGRTSWRNGGTSRPNIPTGEILRWRRCAHCDLSQYHAYPMTEDERQLYSAR